VLVTGEYVADGKFVEKLKVASPVPLFVIDEIFPLP
tara:strand:+ start:680 stop:787 length:108 start_codon:yes stop_codon:yes gene_type:complete